jgi:hypothetical protein
MFPLIHDFGIHPAELYDEELEEWVCVLATPSLSIYTSKTVSKKLPGRRM